MAEINFSGQRQMINQTREKNIFRVWCVIKKNSHRCVSFSFVIFMLFPFSIQAEEDKWRLCSSQSKFNSNKNIQSNRSQSSTSKNMKFAADHFEVQGSEYHLKGNVMGGRENQKLSADTLNYNKKNNQAYATGNVRYEHGERILVGENANIDLENDTGNINAASFWITDQHIRGNAESLQFEGESKTLFKDVTFTTCNEGSDDWLLKASSLHLNTKANEGIARHARIRFMGVPIFYFPYLSFPLEGRKSGFLVPSIGETSNSGTELRVPYYWNIAPHRDATLTPVYLSRRGLLLESEFRYLNKRNRGQIEIAHIYDDRLFDDDRTAASMQHYGNPSPGWRTQLLYSHVSDEDYLDDFGNELATSSVTHLERYANVNYRNDLLSANLFVQSYQTVDGTIPGVDKPYQRLPQLQMNSRDWKMPLGFTAGLDAEAVRFDREEGVIGNRFDVQPSLSWPWHNSSGFVIPKLTYRHTQYQLSRSSPGFDDNPSRGLPIFSLDSGLFFERELSGDSYADRQTLEPRLFYLQTPYRNQDNLIVDELGMDRVFDTSTPLFSFSQMFRENRFSGADRVGDTNQLSAALTTRFMDKQGRELLSASVGRTHYFQDRKVGLPGTTTETDSDSDWITEVISRWTPSVSARASVQWDTEQNDMERGSAYILYKKNNRRILRLSYRFEENSIEQSDMAFIWPVTSHWSLVGRWLHSIRDDITLESLKGVEYESCCWTARLVQRSYRVDVMDDDENDSIWFQLELKGLTSVGRGIKSLITRDIISP